MNEPARRVLELTFGDGTVELELPRSADVQVAVPRVPAVPEPAVLVTRALEAPLAGPGWREFAARPGRMLCIINDHARLTPSAQILEFLALEPAHADLLVAGGSHRAPRPDELERLLATRVQSFAGGVFVHDAADQAHLRFVGKTRRQTPVWLNERIFHYDRLCLVSSVEPHYFAGMMGGRKSFLPGVAGLETITVNHRLALDPAARVLRLVGNPVHEDMTEAARFVFAEQFACQVVTDKAGRIVNAFAGELEPAFTAAAVGCRELYARPLDAAADVVVAVITAPHDRTFHRARRALEFARDAVRPGGVLVLVAACPDGLGTDEFLPVFEGCAGPAEALERIARDFRLGMQKPAKLCQTMLFCRVWAYTGLPEELARRLFLEPVRDLSRALARACAEHGPDCRVLVVPDAAAVIPLTQGT